MLHTVLTVSHTQSSRVIDLRKPLATMIAEMHSGGLGCSCRSVQRSGATCQVTWHAVVARMITLPSAGPAWSALRWFRPNATCAEVEECCFRPEQLTLRGQCAASRGAKLSKARIEFYNSVLERAASVVAGSSSTVFVALRRRAALQSRCCLGCWWHSLSVTGAEQAVRQLQHRQNLRSQAQARFRQGVSVASVVALWQRCGCRPAAGHWQRNTCQAAEPMHADSHPSKCGCRV